MLKFMYTGDIVQTCYFVYDIVLNTVDNFKLLR